jgi:DNA-directed RNA polymerase specialized sigma subunit
MYGLPDDFKVYSPATGTEQLGKLEPDYVAPYKAWKANDTPETRAALLDAVSPVLSRGVTTYGGGEKLMGGHAKLLALKALPTYDPQQGRLDTHLLSHLQGLQRIYGKQQQLVKVPERMVLDYSKLQETEKELEDKLGRLPTIGELQRQTGLSRGRITKIRQASPGMSTGSMVPTEENDLSSVASRIIGDDRDTQAWLDFVHDDLNPTDQLIMEHLMGMYGKQKMSTKALAKKLAITPSAVSQRAAKIQNLINQQNVVWG